MNSVPQGLTQKGVNKSILNELNKIFEKPINWLDVPCGHGDLLEYGYQELKQKNLVGIDLFPPTNKNTVQYLKIDVSLPFSENVPLKPFDLITCISGVMAFDNISMFFRETRRILKKDGVLVVTNDNFWTLRDRISYLLTGRFRRFKLCNDKNEGNWNIVTLSTLHQSLEMQGYQVEKIQYTSIYPEDWLLLPLAFIIYLFQGLHLLTRKSDIPVKKRFEMFPITALLARHYILYCKQN